MSIKDKRFRDKARQLIGDFIKERRKEVGYSQEELANMAGIRRATLTELEAGGPFTINTLLAILGILRGQFFIEWADIESIPGFAKPKPN